MNNLGSERREKAEELEKPKEAERATHNGNPIDASESPSTRKPWEASEPR